ncbi:unnamed protein product [Ambrosiozyma monospora]|uniref:Unnamed protein product n=1 Tax=Ambrosiozyma monospora TaxID=43982 RepID=A0ACB5U0P4_AMBMO|nr:unnamed protein product [Ambrosiozyma monospora]
MVEVKRTVRITTEQHVMTDVPPIEEGFPMRKWTIQITLLDDKGQEVPATIFDKVTYHLHPTFANPHRVFKKAPFKIEEQGWGGFDIPISLTLIEKGGDKKLNHDLNFGKEKYVVDQQITINSNKVGLLKELTKSGPVANFNGSEVETGGKRKANSSLNGGATSGSAVKKMKVNATKAGVDLEKMAEYLTHLKEDDLLGVVQMVNDNKTSEMSIKNDEEHGEFTMDLYTLPDTLLKSLWDYVKKRAE